MRKFDLFVAVIIAIALPIILFMSGANIYSVLMATGESIFIENKWIALCLSALAPISSIALKLISHCFSSRKGKQRYEATVYSITSLSFFIWCILYSLSYSAPIGGLGFDWEMPVYLPHALVFFQLFTEIAVGTALFLGLESLLRDYQADAMRPNATHNQIAKLLVSQQQKHEAILTALTRKKAELGQLQAKRQTAIVEAIASFNTAHTHLEQLNKL